MFSHLWWSLWRQVPRITSFRLSLRGVMSCHLLYHVIFVLIMCRPSIPVMSCTYFFPSGVIPRRVMQ